MYSTNQETGTCLPLLMGYAQPEKIQEVENDEPVVYDQRSQKTVVLILRLVGTKCLKTSTTWVKVPGQKGANATRGQTDKKNEIDDQKNV